jgi:predicted CopG family antitoxin
MPTIRIDDEVFEGLKKLAEPLVDSPSSVIRRLLEEKGLLEKRVVQQAKPVLQKTHAEETQTPQSLYEQHLLATLHEEFNGHGDKKAVTLAVVERMMKRKLISAADLEFVSTGETKAENKIAWGRNLLKNRGLISRDSPRGVWELTAEGRAAAKRAQLPIRKP